MAKKNVVKPQEQQQELEITSFKGFGTDWKCRDLQYAVGESYEHEGSVNVCKDGFHACEYPLDVFGYYAPAGSKFALVKQSGHISNSKDGRKVASQKIHVVAELNFSELTKAAIEYTTSRCMHAEEGSPAHNTGDCSVASNTGLSSVASNTGFCSVASNTGARSSSSNTGDRSVASNTGFCSSSSNTGFSSASSNTGDSSMSSNTGYRSVSSNTGYRSMASNTGLYSVASNTGDCSASSNTGDSSMSSNTGRYSVASNTGASSVSSNTGRYSVASNTGRYSASSVGGNASVAIASGYKGRAMACEGSAICLVHRNNVGDIVHIRSSKVGENGVKAGVWYMLNSEGEFVEAY